MNAKAAVELYAAVQRRIRDDRRQRQQADKGGPRDDVGRIQPCDLNRQGDQDNAGEEEEAIERQAVPAEQGRERSPQLHGRLAEGEDGLAFGGVAVEPRYLGFGGQRREPRAQVPRDRGALRVVDAHAGGLRFDIPFDRREHEAVPCVLHLERRPGWHVVPTSVGFDFAWPR